MPTIIENLPFDPIDLQLAFPNGNAVRKRRQIILMVSVTEEGAEDAPDGTSCFPAVFDTGFNDSFLIQEEHLIEWGNVHLEDHLIIDEMRLPFKDERTGERRTAPIRQGDVWIHPNVPGSAHLSDQEAFRLELPSGISVPPKDLTEFPRLPLLGMRVLEPNGLQVVVNGTGESVSIRTGVE